MTSSLGAELPELISLALVITLSPLSVIPGILMLHTPKPRPTSIAFLVGWAIGIAGLTAGLVAVSNALGGLNKQPTWAPYVRIVVGVALIVSGLYRWFTRNRSAHTPGWMTSMTTIGPGRAFVTAIVLAVVNPKVLFMCAAAGLAIGSAGLGATGAWTADVVFTAVAASSVALPVLAYLVAGEKLDEPLTRLKNWMEEQHATLVAAILVILGLMVLYKGIHGL
ncbi:GAP family protein [Candidatus Mycolicibacterium alkanivorans]|uniref:GAP family protein n=1 Tax=Candidatus Mycolicibacterium alkanivorans TaxID=2954114 RepID=A0ABS9YR73_9MYCO|nr:GAP family protein [Candidatus Mycolicibacterium alkanivorans]MCI4673735.1 GAP family protein [Candidatus Mycolicibacterium alkanivorans]